MGDNINMYCYHPTNGTCVDLEVDYDDYGEINYYRIINIWDPTGNWELDPKKYDKSWIDLQYLRNNGEKC
jgi:hypothetical protein